MKLASRDAVEGLQGIFRDIQDPSQRVIAFVGAGLSQAPPAEIPGWISAFEQLCDECATLGSGEVATQCRIIASASKYSSRFLVACFDDLQEQLGQVAFESAIQKILSPKRTGTPDALNLLAGIPFTGIITTNIDKLIEEACAAAVQRGERPNLDPVVVSLAGRSQGNLARQRNWLWKIHGTTEMPDTWVFTSSQYAKSIYANESYMHALRAVVQGARLVFMGFGGSDPDIDSILKLLADYFGGRADPHLLLTRESTGLDLRRLANYNIQVIEYDGSESHSQLIELLRRFPRFPEGSHDEGDLDDSHYRKWLGDEVGYIDIRGIGGTEGKSKKAVRLPILNLYTKLYVMKGLSNWDLDRGRIRGAQRTELTEVVEGTRCIAIMGDPGSGKTTFLRYLSKSYLEDLGKPLPFYFSIADVYRFAVSENLELTPNTFIEFLLDLSVKKNLHLSRTGLQSTIRAGRCIWLMDSLDLIPSSKAREAMVLALEVASREWHKCQFVLVSRPRAMTGKAIPTGFELFGIDEMREGEARSFIETWTDLLFDASDEETRRHHSSGLLSTIRDNANLRILAKNPVMLTCMAVVHYNEKRLPEGRADLLEAVIQWLMHAREHPSASEPTARNSVETVYRELALHMLETRPGGRYDRIGKASAAKVVARYFGGDENVALKFLTEEETETGILVLRGEGDLEFWHLWFQEYLAAKEIAGKTDEENTGWWSRLRDNLDKPEWREVISFVPACLQRLGRDRVDLFFTRLASSCADSKLVSKAKIVGLGGCILKDLRVAGYEPTNVVSWANILRDVVPIFSQEGQGISLEDRYEAAVAYGLGGDDRLRNFEETWVEIQEGAFMMGAQVGSMSSANYDPNAARWETPVVEVQVASFELRKYPITVSEFALFVSDGGYETRTLWSNKGWNWRLSNGIIAPGDWEVQILCANCPVTAISYFEAEAYCSWLTSRELMRNVLYRLPSEAEWEYAARRRLKPEQRFPWGNGITQGERAEANFGWCGLRRKTPVGMFPKSNTADSIVDMFGNIEEWCADNWTPDHAHRPKDGKAFARESMRWRVVKGGSTIRFSRLCRPSYRSRIYEDKRYLTVGFRPVRVTTE